MLYLERGRNNIECCSQTARNLRISLTGILSDSENVTV